MQVATKALRLALVVGLGVGCFATAGNAQRGSTQCMESGRRPSATVPGVSLNANQRTQIRHSRQQTQAQIRAIQQNFRLSAVEQELRIRATRRRGHAQVMGYLTPRQRQQFTDAYLLARYRSRLHARTTTSHRQNQQRSARRTHRSY